MDLFTRECAQGVAYYSSDRRTETKGRGNPTYTAKLQVLDLDFPQYIHDNTDDEITCRNEMLKLMKDCVRLDSEQRAVGKICGELIIKRGLKRRARKRKPVIDHEMKEVFERFLKVSKCDYVFTSPQDPTKPLGPWVLEEQIRSDEEKDQDPS